MYLFYTITNQKLHIKPADIQERLIGSIRHMIETYIFCTWNYKVQIKFRKCRGFAISVRTSAFELDFKVTWLRGRYSKYTCTVVELPLSLELELAGVTLWGEARVFKADSDMDMLCDIAATSPAAGVVTRDAPAPLSCDKQETDHGRALLPARFLRSCTCVRVR